MAVKEKIPGEKYVLDVSLGMKERHRVVFYGTREEAEILYDYYKD